MILSLFLNQTLQIRNNLIKMADIFDSLIPKIKKGLFHHIGND